MLHFKTKQKGYGRQGLYFVFNNEDYYIKDVFPNISEHFNDYELLDDCFGNEEEGFRDINGCEVTPINSWDEFLTETFKEEIGEILFNNLNHNEYNFDFEEKSYEDICEWAINY